MNRCISCGTPLNDQNQAYCDNCIVGIPESKTVYYWEDDSQFVDYDESDHLDSTFKNGGK